MYLFDFPSKITKVKNEKKKDNQPHGSYDQCYLKKKKEVMIGGTQILLSRICVPLI